MYIYIYIRARARFYCNVSSSRPFPRARVRPFAFLYRKRSRARKLAHSKAADITRLNSPRVRFTDTCPVRQTTNIRVLIIITTTTARFSNLSLSKPLPIATRPPYNITPALYTRRAAVAAVQNVRPYISYFSGTCVLVPAKLNGRARLPSVPLGVAPDKRPVVDDPSSGGTFRFMYANKPKNETHVSYAGIFLRKRPGGGRTFLVANEE